MPQRIVTERDNASDLLDSLTAEEERFYERLLRGCPDDYAQFDAHPGVVRSESWKRNPDLVTLEQIEEWLQGLAAKGVIMLYEADGQRYGKLLYWRQAKPRAQKSKFPAPSLVTTHGSADLPAEPPAAVPPVAEGQGVAPGGQDEREQEPRTEQVRSSQEYREYMEACDEGHLNAWKTITGFEQLFRTAVGVAGREWPVLIEVAREAALSASGKSPNVFYGISILNRLPRDVLTRELAREHFEARRSGTGPGDQSRLAVAAGGDGQVIMGKRPRSTDEID